MDAARADIEQQILPQGKDVSCATLRIPQSRAVPGWILDAMGRWIERHHRVQITGTGNYPEQYTEVLPYLPIFVFNSSGRWW